MRTERCKPSPGVEDKANVILDREANLGRQGLHKVHGCLTDKISKTKTAAEGATYFPAGNLVAWLEKFEKVLQLEL
ncbi:hypothetical protein HPB50_014055 [Hyalomma asiaticum]|uniref:Uncharacterized protein n=1 Tax=Hyalomma asiaticum TaxID=266040 RepID=A0ACB7TKA0_HYAAI|nr:hypothetical protein HPB50_014055 [Hyalomma asiaticum]